eukprot:9242-Heterococcus_DN1.PRE.1
MAHLVRQNCGICASAAANGQMNICETDARLMLSCLFQQELIEHISHPSDMILYEGPQLAAPLGALLSLLHTYVPINDELHARSKPTHKIAVQLLYMVQANVLFGYLEDQNVSELNECAASA